MSEVNLPSINLYKLSFSYSLLYVINSLISIVIIKSLFSSGNIVKLLVILYLFLFCSFIITIAFVFKRFRY